MIRDNTMEVVAASLEEGSVFFCPKLHHKKCKVLHAWCSAEDVTVQFEAVADPLNFHMVGVLRKDHRVSIEFNDSDVRRC